MVFDEQPNFSCHFVISVVLYTSKCRGLISYVIIIIDVMLKILTRCSEPTVKMGEKIRKINAILCRQGAGIIQFSPSP